MPSLGKVSPASTADTLLYVVPANTRAAVNISITNRSAATVEATVSLISGADFGVSSIDVTAPGTGLAAIATLAFSGAGGSGAAATVAAVQLTEFAIASGGSAYTVGSVVSITGGTATVAAQLRVTAVDANGAATTAVVHNVSRYSAVISGTTAATTAITGVGSGMTITVAAIRYGIATAAVTAPGNDYTAAPTITPSSGTGAVFAPQMTRGAVEEKDATEFKVSLPASGVLERTGIVLSAGGAILVKSSVTNSLNAFAFGVESIA